MAANLAEAPALVTAGNLGESAAFVRPLRASNVGPNTILANGGAVRRSPLEISEGRVSR